MVKDILIIIAVCALLIMGWITYIAPGLAHIKIDDPYKENIVTEILAERNLLTQKNNFSGKVRITKEEGDIVLIRLENIKQKLTLPVCRNVQLLLTLDNDPKNSLLLGKLKGTEGNMNYYLPEGEDIKDYNSIMIWCKSYRTDWANAPIIAPEDKPLFLR
jgi:hypothetical protein